MTSFISTLLLPFHFDFMREAFYIVFLVSIPTSILSCFLILKGWSLMGDAISHAVLPGIAIAYIASIPLSIGAFLAAIFCGVATGYLNENSRINEDTIMGIVFSSMFALGVVIITKIQSNIHLDHILFGDPLGVNINDIITSSIIFIVVITSLIIWKKDLLLFVFDEKHAKAIGLSIFFLRYGLLVILSLSIVSALQAVGIILVVSMLIAPGASAFLLTKRFQLMIYIAQIIALTNSFFGVYISFFIDSSVGPTIILSMSFTFFTIFSLVSLKKYLFSKKSLTTTDPNGSQLPL